MDLKELFKIRRFASIIDEVIEENGVVLPKPIKKVAVMAVVKNPYVGSTPDNLDDIVNFGGELGETLGKQAVALLGGQDQVESFGKAAIVGENCEIELGAAMIHGEFGNGMRRSIGKPCKSIILGTHTRGGMGTVITVPLSFREAMRVRSHYDAMEVRVESSPRADEILAICAMTNGGRPLPRIGGITIHNYKGEDGLS